MCFVFDLKPSTDICLQKAFVQNSDNACVQDMLGITNLSLDTVY